MGMKMIPMILKLRNLLNHEVEHDLQELEKLNATFVATANAHQEEHGFSKREHSATSDVIDSRSFWRWNWVSCCSKNCTTWDAVLVTLKMFLPLLRQFHRRGVLKQSVFQSSTAQYMESKFWNIHQAFLQYKAISLLLKFCIYKYLNIYIYTISFDVL